MNNQAEFDHNFLRNILIVNHLYGKDFRLAT